MCYCFRINALLHTLGSMQSHNIHHMRGANMSKPSSAVKRKYNKSTYHRYEFSVNINTKLDYLLEKYKINPKNNLSALIRNLLCQHFDVEPDEIYSPYYMQKINGEWVKIPNDV